MSRERFEEWARSQGEDSASFVSGKDGRYRSPTLEGEWRLWQAAVAAESARRDVERCVWEYSDERGDWAQSCGPFTAIEDEAPDFAFCPDCGKRIEIKEAP